MNQFPTLFLTFKDVDGLDYASARDMLRSQIARLCNEHSYLADSPSVNENDRKEFIQLADIVDGKPTDTMLKNQHSALDAYDAGTFPEARHSASG